MFQNFTKFFENLKWLSQNSRWYSFTIYLLFGFVTAFLLAHSVYGAVANPSPNLGKFDSDIYPPIWVSHNPPLIARFDETVKLEFDFACGYSVEIGTCCRPNAILLIAYGGEKEFTEFPLIEEDHDSLRVLSRTIPATNENGEPLRYYLQVHDPEVNLDLRFPVQGTIDLFVVSNFIEIKLPPQKVVEPGELVLAIPWGKGPEMVGLETEMNGYPWKHGPNAMDVAADGKIALLDNVNNRVLIFEPTKESFTSYSLPFTFKSRGDIQFDPDGGIALLDLSGEQIETSPVNVPHLYHLSPDGLLDKVVPVYAMLPFDLTDELNVVDMAYNRLVLPISASGEANTREAQRQTSQPNLLAKYIGTLYDVRFADIEKGVAFEVHSTSPLGAIAYFEKTPQGYVAVFAGINSVRFGLIQQARLQMISLHQTTNIRR